MNFLNCNVKATFWSALLKIQLLKHASVLVNPFKGRCCMILRNSCKETPVCIFLYSRLICLGGQTATPHWDCSGPIAQWCRHNPLRATSGKKAKCHQKASNNNNKKNLGVFSATQFFSRHPQRGLLHLSLEQSSLFICFSPTIKLYQQWHSSAMMKWSKPAHKEMNTGIWCFQRESNRIQSTWCTLVRFF